MRDLLYIAYFFFFLFLLLEKLSLLDPQLFLVYFPPILAPVPLEQGLSEHWCRCLAAASVNPTQICLALGIQDNDRSDQSVLD